MVAFQAAGANCPSGGTAVQTGLDDNGDGKLDAAEVRATSYICNGGTGSSGNATLIALAAEPAGTNCAAGGTEVKAGVDADNDNILDLSEVSATHYVCDGADGQKSLVRGDEEAPGANCLEGGIAVKSGVDASGDGVLDDAEVSSTQYLCNAPSLYPTKWARSWPTQPWGEVQYGWHYIGRDVTLYKQHDTTRLKITVSDNLRVGYNANGVSGGYSVRINGGHIACDAWQYEWNSMGWNNNYHFPFANVCITEPLPKGLYDVAAFVSGNDPGFAYHNNGMESRALLLVEEMDVNAKFGLSQIGAITTTTSASPIKANGREVVYTKAAADSLLKVTYADTLRVGYNTNGGNGEVRVRMDGSDVRCHYRKYDNQNAGMDFHHPFVMTCILPGVAAGEHTFDVWLNATSAGETYLGWSRSSPTLLVEEIAADASRSYVNDAPVSGELAGAWAGVNGRALNHTVTAQGKAVKVTFSDTFRAVYNCNGRYGFFQLYVDDQPTKCQNAQYVWNSGGAGQDHHHAVNLTCIIPNLTAGAHRFAIWSTSQHPDGSGCGSNHFGYNRGQSLLLVEELP